MDSTPLYDDETEETPRHTKRPIKRRNGEAEYRQARSYHYSRPYYSDEHPEVPKVKRASLHIDEAEPPVSTEKVRRITKKAPSSAPTAQLKRIERDPRGPSSISRAARGGKPVNNSTARPPVRSKHVEELSPRSPSTEKIPRVRTYEEDFLRTFVEDTGYTETHPATKIMVAHRRRSSISTVYEPPSHGSHRSRGLRKKQQNTLYTQIQRLGHNRMFMLTASIIIVILIILPIIVNVIVSNTRHQITTISNPGVSSTAAVNNPSGVQPTRVSADSHGLVITPSDVDHPAPPVFASSAYLLDADTGATLYAYNPFTHLPMMSTTKLMTAILAAEKGKPDQKIAINDAISNDINYQLSADSSVMGIKKGETYTLRDLLYGLLLPSGNDAAVVIADAISGSVSKFVAMMNQRANELGLHDTHYTNPHGLQDQGHYSSAHDLALLGKFSMSIPLVHQVSSTKNYHITQSADHTEHTMFNGNQFMWWYPGVDGGKPGWDGDANFVQVVSTTRNNHHLIGVAMHTKDWWTDMRDLMNWGFNNFQWISPHDVDAVNAIPYDTDWNFFTRDKKDNTLPTADAGRYYIYTGYSISGSILTYFDKNGGLQKFGYPTSLPKPTASTTVTQQFEHNGIQCNTSNSQCHTA